VRKVLVIHGPNLNLLGKRDPDVYGTETLDEINTALRERGLQYQMQVESFQSNHEGDIVDKIQSAQGAYDLIILNPAAFTHYSIAIRDAVEAVSVPVIEVHVTNVHARERFRRKSVIAPVCAGQIAGFGAESYLSALAAAEHVLGERRED